MGLDDWGHICVYFGSLARVTVTTEEQWMFSLAHGDKIQIQKDPY